MITEIKIFKVNLIKFLKITYNSSCKSTYLENIIFFNFDQKLIFLIDKSGSEKVIASIIFSDKEVCNSISEFTGKIHGNYFSLIITRTKITGKMSVEVIKDSSSISSKIPISHWDGEWDFGGEFRAKYSLGRESIQMEGVNSNSDHAIVIGSLLIHHLTSFQNIG